jgi:adenylate cyclase
VFVTFTPSRKAVASEQINRRLSAILAADVVEYSRLMAADERGTLAMLKLHREELFGPKIAQYHGRVVKLMGDGILAEFPSVVDAVECAMDIQQGMAERNADVEAGSRLVFRIGVNLGDIIIEGEDIYGDGVNIAARLEGLAEPGGICISRAARDQVRDKIPIRFEDLGERQVKNMPRPVRAFRIHLEFQVAVEAPAADKAVPATPASEKPSIAILPFTNMSQDPEQEYFSDGISEDIITGLSKNRSFFVISRGTSFKYKGAAIDVAQIAKELSVRYVLEGSVRKVGNRVRISAQLSDAPVSHQVWAERYDRELDDIFSVQDEITQNIIGAIAPGIMSAEIQRA